MTLREWLGAREPALAPALAQRILELAAPYENAPGDVAGRCLAAAEHALARLLRQDASRRESALDLLAIDALVTYTFEAAADVPDRVPGIAREAMTRLSRIAGAASERTPAPPPT